MSQRFILPSNENEKDWKENFTNASDVEKAKIKERIGNYDYNNLPELKKYAVVLNNDESIFAVHLSTTGMDKLKDEIICIDIVNAQTNHALRIPLQISEAARKRAITDKFNAFEYTGIKADGYSLSTKAAEKALSKFISEEVKACENPEYSIVGFQTDFINSFLDKYPGLKPIITPSVDTCVLCNEINGHETQSGRNPIFSGRTSMSNIAGQLGQKSDTGLDKAYLNLVILDKINKDYKFITADYNNLKGLAGEPNFLFVDDYLFALDEETEKMKEQTLSLEKDSGREEAIRPAIERQLYSNIWNDKVDIVVADNVQKIGEASIPHASEYKQQERPSSPASKSLEYGNEERGNDIKDMTDFAKILSEFTSAVSHISDAIDRQTEEIEKSRKSIDKLTHAIQKSVVVERSFDKTAQENAEKNAGPVKQLISDLKGHETGTKQVEYTEYEIEEEMAERE